MKILIIFKLRNKLLVVTSTRWYCTLFNLWQYKRCHKLKRYSNTSLCFTSTAGFKLAMDEVLQTCLCMEKPEMTLNGMELWGQEGTEVDRVTTSIRNWDKNTGNTGTAKMCSQKEIVWKRKWKIEIVKEWYHSGIMIHNTLVSNAQINPSMFLRLIPSRTRVGHSANIPRLWHSLLSRRQLEEVWRVPRNKKKKR